MKFLVDAQLPRRLAIWLNGTGHHVLHTLDLPLKNQTPDSKINKLSFEQERIVITKDADFVDSFLLGKGPHKLLLVSTGNITNHDLLTLFERNLEQILEACSVNNFVELNQQTLIVHS